MDRQLRISLITVLLVLTPGIAWSADWEQIDDSDGITIWVKEFPNQPLKSVAGESLIEAPIEKVFAVLSDHTREREWVDRLEYNSVLQAISPFDRIQYQHFNLPWPITDRDIVYRATATREPDGTVKVLMNSVQSTSAPPTIGIRANLVTSSFSLTPHEAGTRVRVEIISDPRGAIPTWVINLLQRSWPNTTLSAIREQVQKPYVQPTALPPITTSSP